jgi:hypothetical protein
MATYTLRSVFNDVIYFTLLRGFLQQGYSTVLLTCIGVRVQGVPTESCLAEHSVVELGPFSSQQCSWGSKRIVTKSAFEQKTFLA